MCDAYLLKVLDVDTLAQEKGSSRSELEWGVRGRAAVYLAPDSLPE